MSIKFGLDIQGNTAKESLSYNLNAIPDIKRGAWMIAVSSIIFKPVGESINTLCYLTSNLIKNQRINKEGKFESFDASLVTVHIKGGKTTYVSYYFEPIFYYINNICDELTLKFIQIESEKKEILTVNCNFYIKLILQKVL